MTLNGAIKQLHELRSAKDMPIYYKPAIAEIINTLLMDAREEKHGKWIGIDDYPHETWECDQCGCIYEEMPSWTPNYCPNCGARMEEVAE